MLFRVRKLYSNANQYLVRLSAIFTQMYKLSEATVNEAYIAHIVPALPLTRRSRLLPYRMPATIAYKVASIRDFESMRGL